MVAGDRVLLTFASGGALHQVLQGTVMPLHVDFGSWYRNVNHEKLTIGAAPHWPSP